MKKTVWPLLALVAVCFMGAVMLAAGSEGPAAAQAPPSPTPPPPFDGGALPNQRTDLFAASGQCTSCHTDMVDERTGADVSIDAFWRSTMMANASRDPYWQASVRVEALNLPELQPVIEDKCATCHMPMVRTDAHTREASTLVLDEGFIDPAHDLHDLAMDGVSCTLCHQIEPDNLGEPDSFSGGFVIDTTLPENERRAYHQFETNPDGAATMQAASGFVPEQSDHITQAEVCAACHTLYTPYVDASGEIAGEFPEQVPYFEWQHSDYATAEVPCQSCHMPDARGPVVTSVTGGVPRYPFAQHVFVGGNAYVQNLFRHFGPEMDVTASQADFDTTYARVTEQLENTTAVMALQNTVLEDGELSAEAVIQLRTGHKFPTGFPSRRAWLHITVTAADGTVVFESGAYEADGRVIGDDHDADVTQYEPHHQVITDPEQVQVYESVMVDTDGAVTNVLLRGSGYLKDNRLLPFGFDPATARDEIMVRGAAVNDPDFTGGGDTVRLQIAVGDAPGPYTVTVELLYLSISRNWAEKLRPYDTDESNRFLAYYDAVPNLPVVVASATATID